MSPTMTRQSGLKLYLARSAAVANDASTRSAIDVANANRIKTGSFFDTRFTCVHGIVNVFERPNIVIKFYDVCSTKTLAAPRKALLLITLFRVIAAISQVGSMPRKFRSVKL